MAPSSQLDSRMVGMRVEVMLPRDAALQYANMAASQGGCMRPTAGPLPVLTCRLQTDFSSHVQAAQCRPWQVWLVGTDATCDDQWARLHPQAEASRNGVSGAGMLPLHQSSARRQASCHVMYWFNLFGCSVWHACQQSCLCHSWWTTRVQGWQVGLSPSKSGSQQENVSSTDHAAIFMQSACSPLLVQIDRQHRGSNHPHEAGSLWHPTFQLRFGTTASGIAVSTTC